MVLEKGGFAEHGVFGGTPGVDSLGGEGVGVETGCLDFGDFVSERDSLWFFDFVFDHFFFKKKIQIRFVLTYTTYIL